MDMPSIYYCPSAMCQSFLSIFWQAYTPLVCGGGRQRCTGEGMLIDNGQFGNCRKWSSGKLTEVAVTMMAKKWS
jgi:hypothetical protein